MEVLIVARNDLKNSALFWIWDAIAEGFIENGYSSKLINQNDLLKIKDFEKISLIIIDISQVELEKQEVINVIRTLSSKKIKIICNYYLPEDFSSKRQKAVLDLLKDNCFQFIFGEQGDEQAEKLNKIFNNKYIYLPHGVKKSTIKIIKDELPKKEYEYDIVFIGAKLPQKKWLNKHIIPTLKGKYSFYLHGFGWRKRDFIIKILHKLGKLTKLNFLSKIAQSLYVIITEEKEAKLYRNSKVCINFHERKFNGIKSHRILNQRLFKIAGCGGIQIVDKDKLINDQFPEEFIYQANLNKKEWFALIDKLIKIEDVQRESMRRKMIEFTSHNHTTEIRAKYILDLLSLSN